MRPTGFEPVTFGSGGAKQPLSAGAHRRSYSLFAAVSLASARLSGRVVGLFSGLTARLLQNGAEVCAQPIGLRNTSVRERSQSLGSLNRELDRGGIIRENRGRSSGGSEAVMGRERWRARATGRRGSGPSLR
jgi:hypothetical protein